MKYITGLIILLMLTGCNAIDENRIDGIINACYTVIEQNPEDKIKRIEKYLDFNVNEKQITEEQSKIIKKCLRRLTNVER